MTAEVLRTVIDVQRDEGAPRTAAGRVAELAAEWHLQLDEEILTDLVLCVNEVVANAIRHGSGEVAVEVSWMRYQRLRVAVTDASQQLPALKSAADPSERGGLDVVDALAVRWGWEPATSGKQVWFELGLHRMTGERGRTAALVRVASARSERWAPTPISQQRNRTVPSEPVQSAAGAPVSREPERRLVGAGVCGSD